MAESSALALRDRFKRAITQNSMKVIAYNYDETADILSYKILGSTGTEYEIVIDSSNIKCNCPDFIIQQRKSNSSTEIVCKHIYVLFIKFYCLEKNFFHVHINDATFRSLIHIHKNKIGPLVETDTNTLITRNTETDLCAICLDELGDLRVKNIFTCIQCRNSFHQSCIRYVLLHNNLCPLCKYRM